MDLIVSVHGRLDTTSITIDAASLVEMLKTKIHAKADVPIAMQQIYIQQRIFLAQDRLPLSHYGIRTEDNIFVIVDPSRAEPMHLLIDSATRDTLTVSIRRYDTVFSLKSMLEEAELVTISDQRLYFNGELLENEHTLAYYNVESNVQLLRPKDVVVLVEREDSQKNYYVCTNDEKISSLKARVLHRFSNSSVTYRLLLKATVLDEDQTLAFYNIPNNTTIFLDHTISLALNRLEQHWRYVELHYFDTVFDLKNTLKSHFTQNFAIFDGVSVLQNTDKLGPINKSRHDELHIVLDTELAVALRSHYNQRIIVANEAETVQEVLSHYTIVSANVKKLILNGVILENFRKLTDCGIRSGAMLDSFVEIIVKNAANSDIFMPQILFSSTIFDVKTIIERNHGISIENQRLIYGSSSVSYRVLDNSEALFDSCSKMVLLQPSDVLITVECNDKSTFQIFACRNESIKSLKRRIFVKKNIPMKRQKLIICDMEMKNKRKIEFYVVNIECKLYLFDSEEIMVKIATCDEKITEFLIQKNSKIEDLLKLLSYCNKFWFYCRGHELTAVFSGRELHSHERISDIGIKSLDIIEISVKSEIFLTIKRSICDHQEVFLGSQTIKNIKNRFYDSSYLYAGQNGYVFLDKRVLCDEVRLEDLNLGKKGELVYMCPFEVIFVRLNMTNGKSFFFGISDYSMRVTTLKRTTRQWKLFPTKILYKGRQIDPRSTFESLQASMWDDFELILPDSYLLWIKPTQGKSFNIGANPANSVFELKQKICEILPIQKMRLVSGFCNVLEDEKTLSDYKIRNGSTIEILSPNDVLLRFETNFGKRIAISMQKRATWRAVKASIEKQTGWLRSKQVIFIEKIGEPKEMTQVGDTIGQELGEITLKLDILN